MKVASPFAYEGELILVEAELRGPRGTALRRLVLDTGAAATTLLPEVLDELGYSARDGDKRTKVHSAIGEEHGYSLNVAEFSALGVTARTNYTAVIAEFWLLTASPAAAWLPRAARWVCLGIFRVVLAGRYPSPSLVECRLVL